MSHRDTDLETRITHAGEAVEHLARLVGNDPELALLLAQEEVRVRVTDGMRQVRQLRGLNQVDLAERMGISQGRVSRLESVHQDRRLDSLVAHLHAVGAELLMAFKVGDQVVQVTRPEGARIAVVPDTMRLELDESMTSADPWSDLRTDGTAFTGNGDTSGTDLYLTAV
jgi:transcriptional regulator with XRE-family HTH domain